MFFSNNYLNNFKEISGNNIYSVGNIAIKGFPKRLFVEIF